MEAQLRPVVCVGAVATDRTYRMHGAPVLGSSNSARAIQHVGGVAHNVAASLARLGVPVKISTSVGGGRIGPGLRAHLQEDGVDVSMVRSIDRAASAEFVALVEPGGELLVGVADMQIFESLDLERFERDAPSFDGAAIVFMDCNPTTEYIEACIEHRCRHEYLLAVDGVSQEKVRRLPRLLDGIDLFFCNDAEAISYLGAGAPASTAGRARALRQRGAKHVVVMQDAAGCVLSNAAETLAYAPIPAQSIDTTGGGDALVAGTLYGLLCGRSVRNAVLDGMLLSALTVESNALVRRDLNAETFERSRSRIVDAPVAV